MKASEIRERYLKFFESKGHTRIAPAPLVLENDPTTLFTSSGMQPLVPYLMGQTHPEGKRLVDSQPSIRLQDIEEVGDNRHTTFFEMLGNWSLGDYFKKEQLPWIFDFLTLEEEKGGLNLDPKRLYVSVFGGEEGSRVKHDGIYQDLLPDVEAADIWKRIFENKGIDAKIANIGNKEPDIAKGRIFYYGSKKNWWSRSGAPKDMPVGEIGGPDSEIFFDFGEELGLHERSDWNEQKCHPNCDCGRFMEIGNSVFMQYKKIEENIFEELPNKNVDFGGGLERLTAATNNDPDVFEIDIFKDLIALVEVGVNKKYEDEKSNYRVLVDHIRVATFLAVGGVVPGNKLQGYSMRRLIRRAVVKARNLKNGEIDPNIFTNLVGDVFEYYKEEYFEDKDKTQIQGVIFDEVVKFSKTLEKGMAMVGKAEPFDLFQSYGFPGELIEELYTDKGLEFDKGKFDQEVEKHKEASKTASAGMFKGGLADHSVETTKLHTATHLLHTALRKVLGEHVSQKGSNITAERLRFDFSHPQKLTEDELKKVEDLINEQIKRDLPVTMETKSFKEAQEEGALAFFGEKYGERVNVYTIGDFSKEVCGGPHVGKTSELGHVRIIKQERIGSGLVRVYASVQNEHS